VTVGAGLRRRRRAGLLVVTWCLGWGGVAAAQQRPLITEDPSTVGAGQILVEMGADWARDVTFPISGLRGDLTTAPTMAARTAACRSPNGARRRSRRSCRWTATGRRRWTTS
jgi:hypothetical protein